MARPATRGSRCDSSPKALKLGPDVAVVGDQGSGSDGGTNEADAYRLAAVPARPSGGLRPGATETPRSGRTNFGHRSGATHEPGISTGLADDFGTRHSGGPAPSGPLSIRGVRIPPRTPPVAVRAPARWIRLCSRAST